MSLEQLHTTNTNNGKNFNSYDVVNVANKSNLSYNIESNSVESFKRNIKNKEIERSLYQDKKFDITFSTFEASDASIVYFSNQQITFIFPDGKIDTRNYIEDSTGKITVETKNGNAIEIERDSDSLNIYHQQYKPSKNKFVLNGRIYRVTQEDRNKCYVDDFEHSQIIFIFDHKNWEVKKEDVKTAFVRGSFTSWKDETKFLMSYSKNLELHYVSINSEDIKNCIGNSGHPEYKFYINNEYMGTEKASFVPEGYIFHTCDANLIVIFSNEDINEIIRESNIAGTIKHLSDFDLTTTEGKEEISNFRLVPGTKKLFRSFHPYYPTGQRNINYDTEKTRIALVQELATAEGIKSDINLTEDCSKYIGEEFKWYDGTTSKITIPKYYQDIMKAGSICHVQSTSGVIPSYHYVYNKPRDPLFYEWVQMIVNFIISDAHEAPFQIHCAIGTDRTGVFSALLGALCGATWEEVSNDYQKTNRMCIKEYRSKALLAQFFQRLLNINDITKVDHLQELLWNHFTTIATLNGKFVFTKEKLEVLKNKLN
ncbi:hypothetical protein H8356DRAFT_1370721 [Neocallimastix lanati (nom. inval.)]|uniref:Tyrosine specific protein phosphatases domain-containing protein n=1 Tax=Neocallimastix californiae TaxID=1754190 RepID=A0A1Y2D7Y3_9FUNG|nr:hypothetical protein H8356DRAFT_1370721 [Neocallimastix sp. JGI-2020a]ORY55236.1 hypothetical protein LY90DRAFT_669754 [Neocallimastix californiae]|eukprot:ORY55236.1 hypothetical protein LY90DRAFT_669754 [Neocallimastix californiae]